MTRKRYPKKEEETASDQGRVDLRNYTADAAFAQFIMTVATTVAAEILMSDYNFEQAQVNEFALKFVKGTREKVKQYSKPA